MSGARINRKTPFANKIRHESATTLETRVVDVNVRNILCRKSGLRPDLTVIVATAQGLKMHGGVPLDRIKEPNEAGLRAGLANLDRHVRNLQGFGQTVLVVFNHFAGDTDEEMALLRAHCEQTLGVPFVINYAYSDGGAGAAEMAQLVVDTIERRPSGPLQFTYADGDPLKTKIEKVARGIYGASGVTFAPAALKRLKLAEEGGMSHFPVCIAKTQFSFSADAKRYGAASGFDFQIRAVALGIGRDGELRLGDADGELRHAALFC